MDTPIMSDKLLQLGISSFYNPMALLSFMLTFSSEYLPEIKKKMCEFVLVPANASQL